jgi:pyruvyl transferase EpsO
MQLAASKRPQFCNGSPKSLCEEIARQYSVALNRDGPIALVDLPKHLNIGDSLIGLGQLAVLERLSKLRQLKCVGARPAPGALRAIDNENGTILIHGGGNFGTLWPAHQRFREDLVRQYRKARIVQLPQSVYFDSQEEWEKSMAVLRSHEDFLLMVRDAQSLQQVEQAGLSQVHLVPDSAFAIKPGRCGKAQADVVVIQRNDCESNSMDLVRAVTQSLSGRSVIQADWSRFGDLPGGFGWLRTLERLHWKVLRRAGEGRLCSSVWRSLFENRLKIGRRLISLGRVVVTDRLHVHILCSLLGKPHVFLDNNYGKIGALAETWGTLGDSAVQAKDCESLADPLRRLVNRMDQSLF